MGFIVSALLDGLESLVQEEVPFCLAPVVSGLEIYSKIIFFRRLENSFSSRIRVLFTAFYGPFTFTGKYSEKC